MWLFQFFMRRPSLTDLQGRTQALKGTTDRKKKQAKGGLLTTYCQVVKYLLKTYTTNENIYRASRKIPLYKQPDRMRPTEYGSALWTKAFLCGSVYDEESVTGFFRGSTQRARQAHG